jgi:hypothetical protein
MVAPRGTSLTTVFWDDVKKSHVIDETLAFGVTVDAYVV